MANASERLFRNPDGSLVPEAQAEWGAGLAYAEGDELDKDDKAPAASKKKATDEAPSGPGGTIEISNPVLPSKKG